MNQETEKSPRSHLRVWIWLMVWSAVFSAGTVLWQAQDNTYWTQNRDGAASVTRIGGGLFLTFILVLIPSYIIIRAWRHWPKKRNARLWLGITSLAFGILSYSFLVSRSWSNIERESIAMSLFWITVWSFLFLTALLFMASLWRCFRWLFRWRILKRIFLALAVLFVLMLLFRLEENWRGRRAWENCRQTWESKGEKFDFAGFIPPPVRDEQNFAMAPVVISSYAGKLMKQATEDTPAATTNVSRLAMELQRTNLFFATNVIIGRWKQAMVTDLKPWQNYYRTRFVTNDFASSYPPMPGNGRQENLDTNIPPGEIIALDAQEFPIGVEPRSPPADVLLALSRFDAVLTELRLAALRPESRFPLNYQMENPSDIPLPHLDGLKRSATVLQLRAVAELQASQIEPALADVKLMLRLSDTLRAEPFAISHSVRLQLIQLAVQPIWEGLAEHRWTDAQLKELNKELQSREILTGWQNSLRAERAMAITMIERARIHRDDMASLMLFAIAPKLFEGLGDVDNFIPELPDCFNRMRDTLSESLPDDWPLGLVKHLPPDGWYEWNKVAVVVLYQKQLLQIADLQNHLVLRQKAFDVGSWLDRRRYARSFGPRTFAVDLMVPAIVQQAQQAANAENSLDMANLACALERYHLEHGEYPAALAVLVPAFVEKIPPDVVNGNPLHYHRTSDGRFVIYSVGWNGKDDGGMVGTNQFGRYAPSLGDWVWQYPGK
jgi:hypothetical protein